MGSKLLTRAQILEIKDIQTEDIKVPEWGGTVRIKSLTGSERDEFEQSTVKQKGNNVSLNLINARAKLVALCIVDEDNKRIFEQADVEALGQKSSKALSRVYDAAARISGITEEDLSELTKN